MQSTFSPKRVPIRSTMSDLGPVQGPTVAGSSKYFSEIYKDLVARQVFEKAEPSKGASVSKGISSLIFNEYTHLPKIISNRLFAVLDENKDSFLSLKQFCDGMRLLNFGNLEQKMTIVFKLIDFNHDGYLTREDCKAILSHIPISMGAGHHKPIADIKEKFQRQVKSQEEVEEMLDACFLKAGPGGRKSIDRLNFAQFLDIGRTKVSDMHMCVLLFLIETLKIPNKVLRYEKPELFRSDSMRSDRLSSNVSLASPAPYSPSSPAIDLTPGNEELAKLSRPAYLRSFTPLQEIFNKTEHRSCRGLSTFSRVVAKAEDELSRKKKLAERMASPDARGDINLTPMQIVSGEDGVLSGSESPTLTPKHKQFVGTESGKADRHASSDSESIERATMSPRDEIGSAAPSQLEREETYHKGEMYRLMDAYKLKPYFYELRGQELYVYRKENDEQHKDMYFLGGGVFLRREADIKAEKMKRTIFSFSIIFPSKRREFFLLDKEEYETWMDVLKQAIGFSSIEEHYVIGEKIGNGKFGVVRQGMHRVSKTPSAIKVIKKTKMNKEDQEATQTEIEILKLCQHPHVVRLYDIFENQQTISLVQEYLEGGDFFTYLEEKKFKLKENMARTISHQIATAVFYLHQYGVIHRDLKPQNIMLARKIPKEDFETIPDVKIMDFGLSKIIGPGERATEPYGTLSYVAPEVLREKPYDAQVDLFSFGVVVYLMLSGTLPFDDEDDHVTAKKTMKEEPSYGRRFSGVSEEAIKFIKSLLEKRPEKRLTIQQVLEHPWLTKDCEDLRERRKTVTDLKRFSLYASEK